MWANLNSEVAQDRSETQWGDSNLKAHTTEPQIFPLRKTWRKAEVSTSLCFIFLCLSTSLAASGKNYSLVPQNASIGNQGSLPRKCCHLVFWISHFRYRDILFLNNNNKKKTCYLSHLNFADLLGFDNCNLSHQDTCYHLILPLFSNKSTETLCNRHPATAPVPLLSIFQ